MNGQQLKNSILQMAVQGKLVPQDPNDEPASVLLERIRKEKEQLIKEGKIKKEKNPSRIFRGADNLPYEQIGKNEPVCIADEVPFEIPDSWEWVRMSTVMTFYNGRAYKKPELLLQGKYPVLRVGNLFTNNSWYYSDLELEDDKYCDKNDLLYAWSASFGPFIWQGSKCIYHYHIWKINHSRLLLKEYLYYYLMADTVSIKQVGHGVSMLHVTKEGMEQRLIAIPPFAEQCQIVKKIKTLFPLIEQYDFTETKLTSLNESFPDLLKKSILQQAVMGKLIPQDENDEPASVLLERIRAEKQKLIAEGKIKKDKNESVIFRRDNSHYEKLNGIERCIDDEIPFKIPDSWEWIRLGNIGDWGSGATPSRSNPEYYNGDIPWLKTGDLNDGYIEYIPEKISLIALKKTSIRLNPTGSVLIAMYGATIGKVGILTFPSTTNQACCACFPIEIYNEYLFYFLMSQKTSFVKRGEGGAQPNISKEKIIATLMPLPPLTEQFRIAKTLNEVLNEIEKLKK